MKQYTITFLFILLWILYKYYKPLGIIITLSGILINGLYAFSKDFNQMLYLKLLLVPITAFIVFISFYNENGKKIFNYSMTNLIRLNVGCLILSSYPNLLLKTLIAFTTITTPTFKQIQNKITYTARFIPVTLWFLLYTITISYFHFVDKDFMNETNSHFNMTASVIIPFIIALVSNQWLEARALFVTLTSTLFSINLIRNT